MFMENIFHIIIEFHTVHKMYKCFMFSLYDVAMEHLMQPSITQPLRIISTHWTLLSRSSFSLFTVYFVCLSLSRSLCSYFCDIRSVYSIFNNKFNWKIAFSCQHHFSSINSLFQHFSTFSCLK